MQNRNRIGIWFFGVVAAPVLLFAALAGAQSQHPTPAQPSTPAAAAPDNPDKDFAATQEQLIKLLRLSPTLTSVVEHDPSLLANQEYVSRNNPELAQFLLAHPQIARNPDFYLFTRNDGQGGRRDQALQRAVWPEFSQEQQQYANPALHDLIDHAVPILLFFFFFSALVLLVRAILENRRWGRIFKLQSEVHGRLIDKFSSTQELAAYMESEAGKRFLEAAPISVGFEQEKRLPNGLARVLTPLQIGIVLVLLSAGFFMLRHVDADAATPMLVLGTLALMPGLGFIISAGITWVLASRLGLMPLNPKASIDGKEQR